MQSLFKIRKEDILDVDNVNSCRQTELDIMRVILIFLMVAVHVQEVIFSRVWEDFAYIKVSNIYEIVMIFVNAIVAFAFMFAMGASIQFSRSSNPSKFIKRGLKLMLIWFMLKVAYIFPLGSLFAETVGLSMEKFCFFYLFNSDILFFAGAFLVYYGLIQKLSFSDVGFTVITLLLFLMGHFLNFRSDSILEESIMGQFVWTDYSAFPFLNWVMVPFLGTIWGKLLIHCKNKEVLYTITGLVCTMVLAMYILTLKSLNMLRSEWLAKYVNVTFFYHCNLLTVLFSAAGLGILLSLCYLISKGLNKKETDMALYVSSKTNDIYILQWIIIPRIALVLPKASRQYSPWVAYALAAVIFAVCIMVTLVFERINCRRKQNV